MIKQTVGIMHGQIERSTGLIDLSYYFKERFVNHLTYQTWSPQIKNNMYSLCLFRQERELGDPYENMRNWS